MQGGYMPHMMGAPMEHHAPPSQTNTQKVFRDKELDSGFILRANSDVAGILHQATKSKNNDQELNAKLQDLALNMLDSNKRCYG